MKSLHEYQLYFSTETLNLIEDVGVSHEGKTVEASHVETSIGTDMDILKDLLCDIDNADLPKKLKKRIVTAAGHHINQLQAAVTILNNFHTPADTANMSPQEMLDIVQNCNNSMTCLVNRLEPLVEQWKVS